MFKIKNFKIIGLILGIILLLGLGGLIQNFLFPNSVSKQAETVLARDIYPLFECPCCGQTIEECVCPMAKERRAFVDGAAAGKVSRDQAIMSYVKKYGLDSLIDKESRDKFRRMLVARAPERRPIISVSPSSYDFGEVSQKKGVATTFFGIRNKGKSDLIIKKLETSCGCTSAAIVYQGKEGPRFGMAGQESPDSAGWQVVIPAGQSARLKVYYDPNVHRDFRGSAIREIYIFSNDPISSREKVSIELEQTD